MSKYQTILAVCETHSISKAASKLNYTSPPSARRLKILKKSLAYLFSTFKAGDGIAARHRGDHGLSTDHLPGRK